MSRLRPRGEKDLASRMKRVFGRKTRTEPKSAEWFQNWMVEALWQDVKIGRKLVGSLAMNPQKHTLYLSIGVVMRPHPQDHVFTLWSPAAEGSIAKFVILGVKRDGILCDGMVRLKTQSWTNGLYFASGRPKTQCILPWPC